VAVYSIPPLGPGWQLAAMIARYRFSLSLEREVVAILEDAYRAIAEEIRRGPPLGRTDRRAIEDRFLEVRALLSEVYGTARDRITPVLRQYAALEVEIATRQAEALRSVVAATRQSASPLFARTVGGASDGVALLLQGIPRQLVVSSARLAEIIDTIDVGGIGFGPWWDRARDDGVLRVRRMIQLGIVRGQNPTQIASGIWSARHTPGPNAWRQSRTVLTTAVRTVTAAIQNESALVAQQQFIDVIGAYRFEAILDARTSSICRSLDGTEYKPDDPQLPVPPVHPNCRSTLVPIVDLPDIGRPNSPRQSYESWLRAQSEATQNAILGRGVAEHWRRGQTTLGDLLSVDRQPLTLAQLRRALFAAHPESYAHWIKELPPRAQDAVLGVSAARRLREGTATVREIIMAAARTGVVTTSAA
jgi:SPP1 gp7 family putative phage head morphogenesis protein